MNRRGVGSAAVVLGGVAAAAALAATGATAQANAAPPEPPPSFGEFPDFTGTPTTVFEIPNILKDVQGDMDLSLLGQNLSGTANEFTSVLGIQSLQWSQPVSLAGGSLASTDLSEFQLTVPGTMGPASDALFEYYSLFDSTDSGIMELIGSPAAGYAMELDLSAVGGELQFFTPFDDFAIPLYTNF